MTTEREQMARERVEDDAQIARDRVQHDASAAQRLVVARTLEEKVAILLEQTSAIAVNDYRDRRRRRLELVLVVATTLVLVALGAIQLQVRSAEHDLRETQKQRCAERNQQAIALAGYLDPRTSEEQASFQAFLRAFGPSLDCSVYDD